MTLVQDLMDETVAQRKEIAAKDAEIDRLRAASGAPDVRVAALAAKVASYRLSYVMIVPEGTNTMKQSVEFHDDLDALLAALRDAPAIPAPDAGRAVRLDDLALFCERMQLMFFRDRDLLAFGSWMQYEALPEMSRLLRDAGFRDAAALYDVYENERAALRDTAGETGGDGGD